MRPLVRSLASVLLSAAASLSAAGCGEPSDPPSQIDTLRVLAVRADHPFAAPGSQANLEMLLHDGSPQAVLPDGSQRRVRVLWMSACVNPSGDLYYECYPALHASLAGLTDADLAAESIPDGVPSRSTLGFGRTFAASIPADAITGRPQAPWAVYPYGVEYVFFAACAGDLRLLPDADPRTDAPVGCFRPGTSEPLGQDEFEFGYYPVYIYDTLVNENPAIVSVTFGDIPPGGACADASGCGGDLVCGSQGVCIPLVPSCDARNKKDCPAYALAPVVDRRSAEPSASTRLAIASAPSETLWVDYYSTAGIFDKDSRIVHDSTAGWFDSVSGLWRPYQVAAGREVRLFAVVHDSRGGVTWVTQDLRIQ